MSSGSADVTVDTCVLLAGSKVKVAHGHLFLFIYIKYEFMDQKI